MTFLDRLSKGVQKGAAQAKFEADKLLRQNKVNSEISSLNSTIEKTIHAIGGKVIEMYKAGGIDVEVLQTMAAEVQGLEAQVEVKKAEYEAIKVEQFEEAVHGGGAAASGDEAHCTQCNAPLAPGAKFCPSCGGKQM